MMLDLDILSKLFIWTNEWFFYNKWKKIHLHLCFGFVKMTKLLFFENDKLKTTPISNSRQLHMIAIADDLSQS